MAEQYPQKNYVKGILSRELKLLDTDDETMSIEVDSKCPNSIELFERLPISTSVLTSREISMLISCHPARSENWTKLREASEAEHYAKAETKDMDAKIEKLSNTAERDSKGLVISEQESSGLKLLVEQIMMRFPPSHYLYVSLGSSPTLVTSIIQVLHQDAVVVDLPISNVGMEVHQFNKSQWDNVLRFTAAAFHGLKYAKSDVVIIDVLQQGRGVAFTKVLLNKFYAKRMPISICSLGEIAPDDIVNTAGLCFEEIIQVGNTYPDAKLVCRNILACTYKNLKTLRRHGQNSVLKIANGEILAPRKDVAASFWLMQNIRDLDWTKIAPQQFRAKLFDAHVMEHDIAGVLLGACAEDPSEAAIAWLLSALGQVCGMTLDVYAANTRGRTRFFLLYGATLVTLQEWLGSDELLANKYGGMFNRCLGD